MRYGSPLVVWRVSIVFPYFHSTLSVWVTGGPSLAVSAAGPFFRCHSVFRFTEFGSLLFLFALFEEDDDEVVIARLVLVCSTEGPCVSAILCRVP